MPNHKAHIIGGFLFTFPLIWFLYAGNMSGAIVIPLFIITIYAQLPDIDHENAPIGILIPMLLVSGIAVWVMPIEFAVPNWLLTIALVALSLSLFYLRLTPHRGITHTITMAAILSLIMIPFGLWMVAFAFIAYESHLILDSFKGGRYFIRTKGEWRPVL